MFLKQSDSVRMERVQEHPGLVLQGLELALIQWKKLLNPGMGGVQDELKRKNLAVENSWSADVNAWDEIGDGSQVLVSAVSKSRAFQDEMPRQFMIVIV